MSTSISRPNPPAPYMAIGFMMYIYAAKIKQNERTH